MMLHCMSVDDGPGPLSGSAHQITGLHNPKMAAPQCLIAHKPAVTCDDTDALSAPGGVALALAESIMYS